MTTARALITLVAASAVVAACSDRLGSLPLTQLDISGVVTSSETGAGIAAASVELGAIRAFHSTTVTTVTTGAAGSYSVRPFIDCTAGGSYHLNVGAQNHGTVSTLLDGRPVLCTSQPQRLDFVLHPMQLVPGDR